MATKPRPTRQRIIEAALRLFNEHHFGNVTTAELAADLGMTEGNLWYHFKSKRALLEAISDLYIERSALRLTIRPGRESVLDDYAHFLATLAGEIRDFRFIFRDRADYGESTEHMDAHAPDIYQGTFQQFGDFFRALKQAGHLEIQDQWLDALVINSVVLIRFSPELFREMNIPDDAEHRPTDWGLVQHLSSFGDALKPDARAYLLKTLDLPAGPITAALQSDGA